MGFAGKGLNTGFPETFYVDAEAHEVHRIAVTLGDLGTTAVEVAAALNERGIGGVRNTVSNLNPVVRYAQTLVRLEATFLDVRTGKTLCLTRFGAGGRAEAALPEAVVAFLEAFNLGDYPELEIQWPGQ